ncbi:hypothetical protein FGG78_25635 [Thioclava sp. BHET1]|nr:hypothetical protein FGG78_25635 [Thioclava sp. BHET1]
MTIFAATMDGMNYLLAAIAILVLTANGFGYLRILVANDQGVRVKHFTRMIFALCLAYAWRSIWWDVAPGVMSVDHWNWLRRIVTSDIANSVFDLVAIYAGVHGLKALYLMVPDSDRLQWRWWSAWAYPPWAMVVSMRRLLGLIAKSFARGVK